MAPPCRRAASVVHSHCASTCVQYTHAHYVPDANMAIDAVPATVDDIEDALLSVDDSRAARSALAEPGPAEARTREPTAEERATVPGAQSIWVKTFGCSHNQSDSEYMMGVLQAYGYRCGPTCVPRQVACCHPARTPQHPRQRQRCSPQATGLDSAARDAYMHAPCVARPSTAQRKGQTPCGHCCRLIFDDSLRDSADAWLINSCTVKSPSQSQMATVISAGKTRGIPVVVAGCVPQGDKASRDLEVRVHAASAPVDGVCALQRFLPACGGRSFRANLKVTPRTSSGRAAAAPVADGAMWACGVAPRCAAARSAAGDAGGETRMRALQGVSTLGVTQIDRVVEVVEEALRGNTVALLAKKALPSLDLPKVRRNRHIEILPLSTGCLGACTYCKTKHARGALGSYALEELVARFRDAVADPLIREVWLSSEDTGAYGRDIGTGA